MTITSLTTFLGFDMAIQAEGKILQAGTVQRNGHSDIALVRYNTDGSRDTTFSGVNTIINTDGTDYVGKSVRVTSDGHILVGGYSDNSTTHISGPALFRFNSDGSLDNTFHNGGPTDFSHLGMGYSLAIESNGQILLAGMYSEVVLNYGTGQFLNLGFGVTRYNADGTLDTSFSGDGRAINRISENDQCRAVAVQTDGKIVLAGDGWGSPNTMGVVRFNVDGTLDSSFNVSGYNLHSFSSEWSNAMAVTVQADGKILVAGDAYVDGGYAYALVRYTIEGTLDNDFGTDGLVTTHFRGGDQAQSVAVQSDGKILVAGVIDSGHAGVSECYFAVVRYNTDGSLDTSFGDGDGKVIIESITGGGLRLILLS